MIRDRITDFRRVTAADLRPDPANWRKHPPHQRAALQGVLDEIGYADALLARETPDGLVLVDGHLRADLDPDAEVPVLVVDLDEDEAHKLMATLDPLAAMAETDQAALDALLQSIEYENDAVSALLESLATPPEPASPAEDPGPQIDRAEELQAKWGTEYGQLWQIGRHRLLCGDAMSEADVARVMDGQTADAVVTDPPYGINREGITNDDPEGLLMLYQAVLSVMLIENAVVVSFQSPRLFPAWLDAVRAAGHKFERMLWLDKVNDETFPWRGWLMKSEAILLSTVGKGQWQDVHPYSHDSYSITSVGQELPKEWGKVHASVKPLEVVSDITQRVSPSNGIVYEPFCGSGTTMVAAEQLGRTCYALEIEPKYVAVTLERMAGMGLEPKEHKAKPVGT